MSYYLPVLFIGFVSIKGFHEVIISVNFIAISIPLITVAVSTTYRLLLAVFASVEDAKSSWLTGNTSLFGFVTNDVEVKATTVIHTCKTMSDTHVNTPRLDIFHMQISNSRPRELKFFQLVLSSFVKGIEFEGLVFS
jgi:hypothetical protein